MNDAHDAAREVLDFWFADATAPRAEWFRKDPAFDARIRERFGPRVDEALAGRHDDWAGTPEGALALIVVLDQFTRNLFRDDPRAFAGDARALATARRLVAAGDDQRLPPLQRAFAYMPFEHAEDLAAQDEAVRLFTALAARSPMHAEMLDYAHRHRDVIVRFGRFPHRNETLGRVSTPEELAFLQQPGSRF